MSQRAYRCLVQYVSRLLPVLAVATGVSWTAIKPLQAGEVPLPIVPVADGLALESLQPVESAIREPVEGADLLLNIGTPLRGRRSDAASVAFDIINMTDKSFPSSRLYLGIHDLTPSTFYVANWHGMSVEGVPYFVLDTQDFGPGEQISFKLLVATVERLNFNFLPRLYVLPDGNTPPRADAGPDRTVQPGEIVVLDGAGSTDTDGGILGFNWSLTETPAGSAAVVDNPAALRPSLTIDLEGNYRLDLKVDDGILESVADSVLLRTDNSAPIAVAGPDLTVAVGHTVALDGSTSHDPDGDPLTYRWALVGQPGGHHTELDSPTSSNPSLTTTYAGRYLIELVVNDGMADSEPDIVVVSSDSSPPVADAGADQAVDVGSLVHLDASASRDADDDPLSYRWSLTFLPDDSTALLSSTTDPFPSFFADKAGQYLGQLIVNDGVSDSVPDTLVITAAEPQIPNRPPLITSTPPDNIKIGHIYRYTVTADDPDTGDTLSFHLAAAPAGMAIDATTGLVRWIPKAAQQGVHTVRIRVTDTTGEWAEQQYTLSVEAPPPGPPAITSFPIPSLYLGESYAYTAQAIDPNGDALTYALEQAPSGMSIASESGAISWAPNAPGEYLIQISATDPGDLQDRQTFTLTVQAKPVPADPAESAPLLDPASGFTGNIGFLFQGSGAVQTGMQPGALEERRAAVVRGRVLARGGGPLAGVNVMVAGAPELGATLTRADGWFDLVVNGGGELVLRYSKPGWLPVQRILSMPTEDYAIAPDVYLSGLDPIATVIELGPQVTETQIARGSVVDDGDGPRRASVMIPPGTTATYIRTDGTVQSLDSLTLRATEYTVGEDGPRAMPGELPAASGYTYAVELSADEVLTDGLKIAGKDVHFNQPVTVYVDNFIGFPVGGLVPVGYYDNDAARWVASDNGRVIKVLSTDGGLAALDLDGSGTPADTAALTAEGITEAERERLAATYEPDSELWRFQTRHLSSWDCNWPYGPPVVEPHCPLKAGGGSSLANATVNERIPLPGTGQSLLFNSARLMASPIELALTDADPHPRLKRVEYQVSIAGQLLSGKTTGGGPNQSRTIYWDGRDAYGRELKQPATLRLRMENVYIPIRYAPADFMRMFGTYANLMSETADRGVNAITLRADRAEFEVSVINDYAFSIGAVRAVDPDISLGDGAMTISGLPLLDPRRGVITSGSGVTSGGAVLQSLLGASRPAMRSDGPGTTTPVALARDTTGALLMASASTIHRLVDGGPVALPGGDAFEDIRRIRQARNGELLVLARRQGDTGGPRLWSLSPDGTVSLLSGSGQSGCGTTMVRDGQSSFGLPLWDPDGGFSASAADLQLTDPSDIAVNRDGDIYLADAACHVVYWLRMDTGDVYVVAGNGTDQVRTDAGPAGGLFRPALGRPLSLALDNQDRLYIGTGHGLIRRLGTDNWIETLAGIGEIGYGGDGGAALTARFGPIDELLTAPNGTIYADDTTANGRLRRIDTTDKVQTVAGTGENGFTADGLTADGAAIGPVSGLVLDTEGRLHFGETGTSPGVRRIASAYAALPWQQEIRVPMGSGGILQVFDLSGRPLRTEDAETGASRGAVSYDAEGRLAATTDEYGRETRYERDAEGRITAVLAPNGQRSEIGYDAFGRPTTVTHPDGAQWGLEYDARSLLTRYTDPNGNATSFDYDSVGRLIRDTDAAGGGWTVEHDLDPNRRMIRYTSGEGRVRLYTADTDTATGIRTTTTRAPHGGQTITRTEPALRRSTTTNPDGTVSVSETLPSAVPAGAVPDSRSTTTLPGGLSRDTDSRSTWALADPADPLSWVLTRQVTETNGQAWTVTYDPTSRTRATTSPEGRVTTTELDALDRPSRTQTVGLAAVHYTYDDRGLLIETRQGDGADERFTTYSYNAQDHLQSITDAEGRTTTYANDELGRVTQLTRPDGQVTHFDYDARGNLTGLTPPDKPEHAMAYSPVDLETGYTPPTLADGTGPLATTYNMDRDLTRRAHALGPAIDYGYDETGRLQSRTTPAGTQTYTYAGHTERVAAITTPDNEQLTLGYDGPLVTSRHWAGTVNGQLGTEWNDDLQISAHTLDGQQRIDYAYDQDGLLTQAGALQLIRHGGHGAVTGTLLNSLITQQSHNDFGELAAHTARHGTDTLYQVDYTRDKLGRITEKTETLDGVSKTYAYTYDAAGRLIEEKTDGLVTGSWTYDANGNRMQADQSGAGTYDAQDRLTAYEQPRTRPLPRGDIDYVIDGKDRRIGKKLDGQLVQGFLYKDQLNPIAELDGDGNIVSVFVYGEKAHIPDYLIKVDPATGNEKTYRILSDHLGSPRLVVETETGTIVQRMDYDVWGIVTHDTNPGFQPFGFAGGIYDLDTGLVRFGARDYDPYTGRWTGKDPIRFQGDGPNLYGYVLSDPVNLIDPNGLQFVCSGIGCLPIKWPEWLYCPKKSQPIVSFPIRNPAIKCATIDCIILGGTQPDNANKPSLNSYDELGNNVCYSTCREDTQFEAEEGICAALNDYPATDIVTKSIAGALGKTLDIGCSFHEQYLEHEKCLRKCGMAM